MKPLMILLIVFTIGLFVRSMFTIKKVTVAQLARIAMSSMLVFTGVGHFVFAEGMSHMLPELIPYKMALIYSTGILEVAGAIGLLIPVYSRWVGILLIIFLLAVLPANIYAAFQHIDPITGLSNGPGPTYLFFRIPLQIFFILWIYLSTIKISSFQIINFKNQIS